MNKKFFFLDRRLQTAQTDLIKTLTDEMKSLKLTVTDMARRSESNNQSLYSMFDSNLSFHDALFKP